MLKGVYYGSRGVAIWADFGIQEGIVMYSTRNLSPATFIKSYRRLYAHTKKDSSAWTKVWSGSCPPMSLLRLPVVAIWKVSEFPGRLIIYGSYLVTATTYLKSFHFLCTYPSKVSGAWTEVWTIPWSSTMPIIAFGGRDLEDF